MASVVEITPVEPERRRAQGSAVCSHQSYERPVQAVCHHSGRYLTIEQTNPERISFLREQHDFPGLKVLDDRFLDAAHAREYQHLIWIRPVVQALAMLIAAVFLLVGVALVWARRDQWFSLAEGIAFYVLGGIAALMALVFVGVALWLLTERNSLYHRSAAGQRPAIDDFPLFGTFRIDVQEAYDLDIDTSQRDVIEPTRQTGSVTVDVIPSEDAPDLYRDYQAAYHNLGVGTMLHAGVVALEGLDQVTFTPEIEYRHRIVLRQPVTEHFAPSGNPGRAPVRFVAPYDIKSTALAPASEAYQRRLLFEVVPQFDRFDSYTLQLHIRWLGEAAECGIAECRLKVPSELGTVWRLDHGRYVDGNNGPEVVWHNLALHNRAITLSMTFSKPLLEHTPPPVLEGSYRFLINSPISGLYIPTSNIWNAKGRPAILQTRPSVSNQSVITGKLRLHVALLAQEHEYVVDDRVEVALEPGYQLTECLTRMLGRIGIDIQRIEEAMPRLDPVGTLDHELRYWDIAGRCYEPASRESADVHLIVHGSRVVIPTTTTPPTVVDVRVRCLHDPRSQRLTSFAKTTHELIMSELSHEIPLAVPLAATPSNNGGSA